MDEVRCPMCSKKNPADAESCEFCGARIKPLIIQQPPEDTPSREEQAIPSRVDEPEVEPKDEEQPQEQLPQETDWLSRMRLGVSDEGEDEPDLAEDDRGPKRGETDLLGRFRDLGISSDEAESPRDEEVLEPELEAPKEAEPVPPQEEEADLEWDRLIPELKAEDKVEPFLPDEDISQRSAWGMEDEEEQEEPPVPDWLARIRAREEKEETEPPKRTGDTDWLSGLRDVSFTDEEEEEELPDELEELLISDISSELKKTVEPPLSEVPSEEEPPASDVDETITSAQASIEDLFSDLDLFEDEAEEISEEEPTFEFETPLATEDEFSDLDSLFDDLDLPETEQKEGLPDEKLFTELEPPSTKEVDDLFSDDFFADVKDKMEEEPRTSEEEIFGEVEEVLREGEEPLLDAEFFADLGIDISEGAETQRVDEPVSDLAKPEEISIPEEEFEEEEFQPESSGIPDLAPGSDLLARESYFERFDTEDESEFEELSEEIPARRSSLSDLLGDFSPSWMEETISEGGGKLPHVPALILDDEMPDLDSMMGEGESASMEIPDWLQDLGKDVEEELIDEEDNIPVLTKATLPPWLEAMRPIETFRAPPEIELELEEEDEIVEAAGPLAGLKGVLLAEPVVAMPRTPITAMGTLDISDRDLQQAEILQRMVEEEEREAAEFAVKRVHVPLLRWVCAAILVLAVVIPNVLESPVFNSPTRASRDLSPFLELVQTLPVERPTLLVFDYDPSYSAEMDAVAGALVENLFTRSQSVVTLSTKPSGPMLADRMMRRVGNVHQAVNGVDYLHLGYLSGGPTALQLLANSPTEALAQGFKLPKEFEGEDVWDSVILTGIDQLSDFSMVAIITSGTESARIWAEQIHPTLGDTPLVMVLSAGTEPIIRPYYEAENPQVDAILSGLPSAMIYEEKVNRLQADATQRWNGYGMGLLVAVMIFIAGGGYGLASWVVQRFGIRKS